MVQGGEGSATRTTARSQAESHAQANEAEAELHDDDELAAVIAAQIQSYTSTAPLPLIDPRNDPRLRPITFDDDGNVADSDEDEEDPEGSDPQQVADGPRGEPKPEPAPDAVTPDTGVEPRFAADPSEATQAIPIAAAPDRFPFVPASRRSARAAGSGPALGSTQSGLAERGALTASPGEPPPTEPISVQLRAELSPPERTALPVPFVDAGPLVVPPSLYEEWERTLRRIGQPAADAPATEAHGEPVNATPTPGTDAGTPVPAARLDTEPVPSRASGSESDPAAEGPATVAEPRDAAVRSLLRPDILPPSAQNAPRVLAAPAVPAAPAEDRVVFEPDIAVPPVSNDPAPALPAPAPDTVDGADTDDRAGSDDGDGSLAAGSATEVPATAAVAAADPIDVDRTVSRPGLLAGLLGWATVLVSAPILLLGLLLGDPAVGQPVTAAAGIAIGAVLALPGSLRLANRASASGGIVRALHGLLGPSVGTVAAVLLVITRILAIGLLLLATDELAAAFVTRTGALPSLPGGVTAVIAALAVTTFGLIGALFRSRAATVVVGIVGFLGVVITLLLVALLTSSDGIRAGGSPEVGPVAAVASAAFAVAVLLLGGGPGAALARIASTGSRWTALIGGVIGALVAGAAWVTVMQIASPDGTGAVRSDTLAGGIVDATAAQLAVPVGVAALVAVAAGVAVLARTGGDLLAGLVRVPGTRGPAGAAVALASLAVALGLVAAGVDAGEVVGRYAPIVLVPLATLAGFAASGPRIPSPPAARLVVGIGLPVATVVGLLAVDGLVVAGERGPLLTAVGVTGTPLAVGLGAALILGALTGLVALLVGRSAGRPGPVPPPARDTDADTVA